MGGPVYCNRLCVNESDNSVYYNWLDTSKYRGYIYKISNIAGTNEITVEKTKLTNGNV